MTNDLPGWQRYAQSADSRVVGIAVFVVSVLLLVSWHLYIQPESGDSAIWDYMAQGILRGQVPYRDIVEIKSPASAYVSAVAIWIGKLAGIRDLFSIRFMQIALTGVLSAVTFAVAEVYLRNRAAALIAAVFPLMCDHFVSWIEAGTEPKLTMILFGMVALLLIPLEKPFWAGFFGMLSFLSWQPGLLFAGVAFLMFSRYLTNWRDGRALKVLLGAATPLAVTLMYFYVAGALRAFWIWTFAYNVEVYSTQLRTPGDTLIHALRVIERVFKVDVVWLVIALAGFLILLMKRSRTLTSWGLLKSTDSLRDGLLLAPLIYIGFCAMNFQSGPDLIPLFPFIGIFAGWLIASVPEWLQGHSLMQRKNVLCRIINPAPAVVVLLMIFITVFRASTFRIEGPTLAEQDEQLKEISGLVTADDKIFVLGAVELLVWLNRGNLNQHVMWDHGKGGYIVKKQFGGSIEGMIGALDAEAPKMVVVSRLNSIEGTALREWLGSKYEKVPGISYEVYLRKKAG